jgi:hypothetical protein
LLTSTAMPKPLEINSPDLSNDRYEIRLRVLTLRNFLLSASSDGETLKISLHLEHWTFDPAGFRRLLSNRKTE